ncbi:CHAT domain-containing protein [Oxalobacteraceae bacterium A2-2]
MRRRPQRVFSRLMLVCLVAVSAAAHGPLAAADSSAAGGSRSRLQDAETLKTLTDEGRLLYQRDRVKLEGFQYCGQSVALAERGEFRLSIQAAAKAIVIGLQQGDHSLVASAKRDLAISYSYAGDLEHAEQYARDAIASGGEHQPAIAGPALKTLGDVAARRGQYDTAIAFYQQADTAASDKFRPLVKISLANAYLKHGQLAQARALYQQLGQPEPALAMAYKRSLGNLNLAEGNYPEALRAFADVVRSASGSDAAYHRLWGQEGMGRTLALMNDAPGARQAYMDAVRTSETIRERFRSEEFKSGLFGDVQQIFDRAIALSMGAGDADGAFALSEQSRSRALLDLVRDRAAVKRSGVGGDSGRVTPATVRAALREGEAIVEFHTLDDQLIAWVVRPSGMQGYRIGRSRKELAADIAAFRQAILERKPAARELGRRLYTLLLAPLDIAAGEQLLIVPHDALHYMPFQALHDGASYLIERHALAFAPSAGVAVQLARRSVDQEAPLVAFGNPGTDARLALPGAEREVEQIGALFTGSQVFIQSAATKSRFRASVAQAGILHVAAHAEVDLVDPLQSRILFAPEGADPGFLEAREIYGINMGNVSLITLSACESGLGRVARGDEILGFTRSFLSAGAAGLLVSLWPVEDNSTELLMTTLYRSLAQGQPSAAAMQRAQLAVLGNAKYRDPYFWAAFDLVGDWRMRLRSRASI